LQTGIESSHPTFRFRAVYPGQSATRADTFEEQSDDTTVHEIIVNPYTAQILIDRRKGATLYDWVRNLHANLLSGKDRHASRETHHCQVKTGAGAGPLVYLKHPGTK
jgi:uncharacterized iron-regulated membrane protein